MAQFTVVDLTVLQKLGFTGLQLQALKKAIPESGIIERTFFQMKPERVRELLGLTDIDLQNLSRDHGFPMRQGRQAERYYDLIEVLRALWKMAHKDGSGGNIDKELKQSRKKKLDIENASRERQLISRKEAEDRNVKIFQAMSTIIQRAIKTSSVMVVGCANSLDAEDIIRSQYNDALRMLKEQAENKEWNEKEN